MKLEWAIVCMMAAAIICCGCIDSGSIVTRQTIQQSNDEIASALTGYTLVAYSSDREYLDQANTTLTKTLVVLQKTSSTLKGIRPESSDERRQVEAMQGVCEGYIAGAEGGLLFIDAMNQSGTVRTLLYEYYMGDKALIHREFQKYHDTILKSDQKYQQSREILASVDTSLLTPEMAALVAEDSAQQEKQAQVLGQATEYYRVLEYLFSSLDHTLQGDALSENGDDLIAQLEYEKALSDVGQAKAIARQLSTSEHAEVVSSAENVLEYLDYIEASVNERNDKTSARIKESVVL